MKVKVEKIKNSQLQLSVMVDKDKVHQTYEQVLLKAVEETEIDGFRKGKAPKEKVEQKLGVSKLYGETINELLQIYYSQALKENFIHPISNPKVEIKEFELDKDFEFTAQVAVKPEVKFKDYRKALKKYFDDKQKEVSKGNAEKLKKGEKLDHEHAHIHPNEVIHVLNENAETEIPDILVEEETNRLISNLIEQVMAAGMKVEDYFKAQKTDMEKVKEQYTKIAETNIKAELVLNELIKEEKTEVTDEEVENVIKGVETEEERENLNSPVQKVYIRTILEKNKLIDKFIKEIEGENHHD